MEHIRDYFLSFVPGLEGNVYLQTAGIFILSIIPFFEAHGAIPLGIVLGFPAIPVILSAIAGNLVSVMAFIWIISKLRAKIVKNKIKKEPSKRAIKARRYFEKYGVPGVSLAGVLLGFHLSAGIALGAGAKKNYVSLWITISIVVCAVIFGVVFRSSVAVLS